MEVAVAVTVFFGLIACVVVGFVIWFLGPFIILALGAVAIVVGCAMVAGLVGAVLTPEPVTLHVQDYEPVPAPVVRVRDGCQRWAAYELPHASYEEQMDFVRRQQDDIMSRPELTMPQKVRLVDWMADDSNKKRQLMSDCVYDTLSDDSWLVVPHH